jgi:hypothetical protein
VSRLKPEDSMNLAILLCHKLALDLDANDLSSVSAVSSILSDLPIESVIVAIRSYLQLERIVCHDLDSNNVFRPLLEKMNAHVKAQDQDPA